MAAVKAIAWSPHHHGLLVSGGGTADRCIRFWNTLTGQPMQCVDTGKSCYFFLNVGNDISFFFNFRFASLQFGMVKTFVWACFNSWLFTKSNSCLEISVFNPSSEAYWSLLSSSLSCTESWWRGYCYRRWWRDFEILERIQQSEKSKGEQKRAKFVHQHSINFKFSSQQKRILSLVNWFQKYKIWRHHIPNSNFFLHHH